MRKPRRPWRSGTSQIREGKTACLARRCVTPSVHLATQHVHAYKLSSAQTVATLMRTWTGILYLCKNDLESIRMLVRSTP